MRVIESFELPLISGGGYDFSGGGITIDDKGSIKFDGPVACTLPSPSSSEAGKTYCTMMNSGYEVSIRGLGGGAAIEIVKDANGKVIFTKTYA